jgi:pilus assembly protein FimV
VAINKNKINDNALKFIQKGQIKKAIKEYEKILGEDPNDVRTLLKKGDLLVRVGEKGDAINTYLRVAGTYSQQGFHLKAVAVFKQILKIDSSRVDVNLRLAEEYQNLGIISDAMNHLQTVVGFYDQQGKTRDSLEILRRIVELDPENIANRIKLAELYSREKMVAEAITEFGQAAKDLKSQNRMEDFAKVGERLIYHDSSNTAMIKELVGFYLQQGDTKRALPKLQICFKADPHDIDTLQMLATAFKDLHQVSKSVSVYKEMAKIHLSQGASDKLREVFQRVREIDPDDADANRYLSGGGFSAAVEAGNTTVIEEKAQSKFKSVPTRVTKPQPPNPNPEPPAYRDTVTVRYTQPLAPSSASEQARSSVSRLLTETDVYIKYGLQNKAIQHLNRIFEIDSDNIEAHAKLRDLYLMAGQRDHAAQQMLNLAYLTSRLGMMEEARAHLGSMLTFVPDHPQGLALAAELGMEINRSSSKVEAADDVLLDQGADFDLDEQPLTAGEDISIEVDDEPLHQLPDEMDETLTAAQDFQKSVNIDDGNDLATEDILDSQTDFNVEELDGEPELIELDEGEDFVADEELDEISLDSDLLLDSQEGFEAEELSEAQTTIHIPSIPEEEPVSSGNETQPPIGLADALPLGKEIEVESHDQESLLDQEAASPEVEPDNDEILLDANGEEFDMDDAVLGADGIVIEDDPSLLEQVEAGSDLIGDEIVPAAEDADGASEATPELVGNVGVEESAAAEEPFAAEESSAVEESEDDSEVAEAIDEVDFFLKQNLVDEAEDVIIDLNQRYPGRPDIQQRLARIEQIRKNSLAPADVPEVSSEQTKDLGEASTAPDSDPFQLAQEVESQEYEDMAAAPLDDFQYRAEDVLSEFKKGVERVVEKEDSATHFDLGIAYKEMGLIEDAMCEFEIASHDAKRRISALSLIGLCHVEKDQYSDAISYFKKALNEPSILDQEKIGLFYEIGRAFEMQKDLTQALAFYQQVQQRDAQFRDIGARVEYLKRSVIARRNDKIDPNTSETPHRSTDKGKITYM